MENQKPFKYEVGDEVMNTTGYKCYIERRFRNERGTNCYEVSTAEEHDLYVNSLSDDEPQTDPAERWQLTENEISHKL